MTVLWLYDCMTVWCTVYGVWQVAADSRTIRFEGTLGYLLPLPPPFPAPTCALRALNATRIYVHLSRAWSLCPLRAGPSCLTCDDDGIVWYGMVWYGIGCRYEGMRRLSRISRIRGEKL